MGSCCCARKEDPEAGQKFEKGGANDLSEGPVKNRSCTDGLCILLLLAAQAAFIIVTVAGAKNGEPEKLYRPRDYRGAYCGSAKNWNDGPDLSGAKMLSYTMNVTSTADEMMKQLVCSTVAQQALVTGKSPTKPLLNTSADQRRYLCSCCLIPCKGCEGSLQVGGDLTSAADVKSVISARMTELTDPSKGADLFSPGGMNKDTFSSNSFWEQATKYFNTVCLPSCDTNYLTANASAYAANSTARNYTYTPPMDSEFYHVWMLMLTGPSNPLTAVLQDTIATAFTFEALPFSVCPYPDELCVTMPGIQFQPMGHGMNYCTIQMAAEVVDVVGDVAASTFTSLGGSAFLNAGSGSFGQWIGDFQQTVDSFIVVSVLSFVLGIIFLVVLRLFAGCCVWISILCTTGIFAVGGALSFFRSGQCAGAALLATGRQATVAVVVAGATKAKNAATGATVPSETMDPNGDGSDYRGAQHYTVNGRTCAVWGEQTMLPKYRAENFPNGSLMADYCRNPYNSTDKYRARTIWCVTTDTEVPWEECSPIGVIQPPCHNGYAVPNEKMRKALYVAAFIIWALGAVWILIIIICIGRIALAIALAKVGAVFLASNPQVLLIPICQALLGIGWMIAWLYSASYLLSQVPDSYTPKGYFATYEEAYGTSSPCSPWEYGARCKATPGKCTDKWPTGTVWKDSDCQLDGDLVKCWRCAPPRYIFDIRFCISFFVFLWNQAFNIALGQCLIAMAVSLWFFSTTKLRVPVVTKSLRTVFRYHIGSIAFGSFIVAVIQFIRYAMKYFEKQAGAQKNRILVLILKVVQCCLWFFEKCVRFLNKNAYIQIALLGRNFCVSAKKAFFLILRNLFRFGTVAVLGNVINYLGTFCITSGTVIMGYLIVHNMHGDISPFFPCVFYLVIGFIVAKLYMSVFGLALDTTLQCFLAVEEMGVGGEFVPSCLASFVASKTPAK